MRYCSDLKTTENVSLIILFITILYVTLVSLPTTTGRWMREAHFDRTNKVYTIISVVFLISLRSGIR